MKKTDTKKERKKKRKKDLGRAFDDDDSHTMSYK